MVESVRTVLGRSPRQVEFRLVAPLHAGEGLNVIRNGSEDAASATSVEVRTDDSRLTARAVVSID